MRSIIVDDEPKSREVLRELLGIFCPEVEVIGEAGNIIDSVRQIKEKKPDLVFFDILLQEGDSFEIIRELNKIDFEMIFVTAFDEDSVKALKFSGAKVLLKPIQIEELKEAVNELKRQKGNSHLSYQMAEGMLKSKLSKIPVVTEAGLEFYPLSEVLYIQAKDSGSIIYFKNSRETSTVKSLEEFNNFIEGENFQLKYPYIINQSEIQDNNRVSKELRFFNGTKLKYS
ncbi:response regulator [bacterium]|nr:response regulator [bacterium]